MKKIIIGFIVGALMFGIIPVMAQGELTVVPNPFPVVIDGVVTEVEGYNINGYTFLKLADFGKAGLTVKFNETAGQIEIISIHEPVPDKGEEPVGDVQVYEENGYDVVKIDGVEYYCEKSIPPWYDLYAKGYGVGYDKATDTAFLMKYNGDVKQYNDYTVLLQNIPQINYKGKTYIEKNFYINKILPLVEKPQLKPISGKGDDVVSDKQVYEENGYKVIMDNEVEYYSLKSIGEYIYDKGYNIGYNKSKDRLFLLRYNTPSKSSDNITIILENIPFRVFNDATHIEKDFYINKILPLIE